MEFVKNKDHSTADIQRWSDEKIIEQVQQGNKDLFFQLVYRYEQRLFRLATVITGNVTDAEDALQDSFLAAFNSIGRFKGKSAFYTWIYRIVINKSKDIRYKRNKMRSNSLDEYELDFSDERLNIPRDIEQNELYNFLIKKIYALKDIYQEILILRYFEQLSYQEISQVLNIREGTVKSRLFKAKDQLKEKILEDEQGGDFIHDLL